MRFIVTREVVETIEIDTDDESLVEDDASASPIELWTRDIKGQRVEEVRA